MLSASSSFFRTSFTSVWKVLAPCQRDNINMGCIVLLLVVDGIGYWIRWGYSNLSNPSIWFSLNRPTGPIWSSSRSISCDVRVSVVPLSGGGDTKILVLLSASVERFGVSHMGDFCYTVNKRSWIKDAKSHLHLPFCLFFPGCQVSSVWCQVSHVRCLASLFNCKKYIYLYTFPEKAVKIVCYQRGYHVYHKYQGFCKSCILFRRPPITIGSLFLFKLKWFNCQFQSEGKV